MNDGGPAFPDPGPADTRYSNWDHGMSLRDYFAAKALPEAIRNVETSINTRHLDVVGEVICIAAAERAYQMADAMLAVRERKVEVSPA